MIIFTTTRKVVVLSLAERRHPGNYMSYSHVSATLFILKISQHASGIRKACAVLTLLYIPGI